jgi:flagellar hook protein FlgE
MPPDGASFTELGKAAAFAAALDVNDSLGAVHSVSLLFFKTGTNAWTVQAYVDAGETGGTPGTPVKVGETNMTFDTSGKAEGAPTFNMQMTFTGAAPSNVAVDLSATTQMAAGSQLSNVTKNGQSSGGIQRYEIKSNGEIYAYLDSGPVVLVGTLQLANVPNQDGLARAGNTLFKETELSGARTTGQPGVGGLGMLRGGSLERSTVDISKEFVELVTLQRGYQANSQLLNTTNQMIRDTIAMMR